MKQELQFMIDQKLLSPRESHIVQWVDAQDIPPSRYEIGRAFGLTQERIRQIYSGIRGKVKKFLEEHEEESA